MKPFDPRLLRFAAATRFFIVVLAIAGIASTALVIVQAISITQIVVPVFTESKSLDQVIPFVLLLVGVVLLRVLLAFVVELLAHRSAAAAKSQLRMQVVAKIMELGPVWMSSRSSGELTQTLTRGIDGLEDYFSKYLPQLILAVCVPIAVGVVILTQDVLAAVIVACTIPLIPVFMILIGLYTQGKVDRQWKTLGLLSSHFVDLVAGMPTLKVFGRAKAQAKNVQVIGDQYRITTMGVLKVSFLSSLVLELLSMLAVAFVAVSIGLRLVDGDITLSAGLLVLILVPEVYLPIRQVGTHFHAAAEGLGAASSMIEILEENNPNTGTSVVDFDLRGSVIELGDVTVQYPGKDSPQLDRFSTRIQPQSSTALIGASGCGKTTILNVLEGFVQPSSGTVTIVGSSGERVQLSQLDIHWWRSQISYVEQSPRLLPGTIAENIRLINQTATDLELEQALAAVDLAETVRELPEGLDTVVGEGGRLLSIGQTQRIALARVLVSNTPIVLFDEPTSALDSPTEQLIIDVIHGLSKDRTVVVVAHSPALIEAVDQVVEVRQSQQQVIRIADAPNLSQQGVSK